MSGWWNDEDGSLLDEQTLDSMPVGLMQLDHDWTVRYLNAAGEATVGYTREELVGRNYWAAFPANHGNAFGRAYRHAVQTGVLEVVEAFYPDPLNLWFEVRAVPTRHGLWLYFTEVTARRQAQQRLALIAQASDTLSGSIGAPSVAGRVPGLLVPTLASWATLTLIDDHGTLRRGGAQHTDPARLGLVERFAAADLRALPANSPLQQAVITGAPVTLGRHQLTGDQLAAVATGTALELLRELDPGALTVVPLRGRDRILGALTLGLDAGRGADPLDRDAGLEIAGRLALALDNTRLYEQQQNVAVELQRQMLTAPPAPDHVQIAVRYQPATQAAQVGGDWYDVFLQPDGATTVVVGDVVGHDLAAAATMGQLRSMLRALGASANTPPAGLLTQLDGVLPQLQIYTYATIAVARFEQSPTDLVHGITRLRWASAGHPAPVVIGPDGDLHPPTPWPGQLMMGVDPHSSRTETVLELRRGSTVVLYTDGLIERRDRDLDDGLTALRTALTNLAHLPLEQLCDELIAAMVDDTSDDDIALVAIRLHPQDRPRPAQAGPSDVPSTVPEDPAAS